LEICIIKRSQTYIVCSDEVFNYSSNARFITFNINDKLIVHINHN